MNTIFSRLPGGRWARRLILALLGLLLLWAVTWLAMPPLLKWQLETRASAALGRAVMVERVDFRPWSLELTVEGLRIAGASGGEQFSLSRFYVDAELQSLFRLAPVLDAVVLEQPRLRVRHLGEGRYDVDDVLARLRPADDQPASDPLEFALFNINVAGGELVFEDDGAGVTHQLSGLSLGVPFLSNLPSRREVVTQPHLAFTLNGSAFDSSAATTPFARTRDTDASVDIPALDLAPYLPYWPATWPVKPESGELQLALKLDFEQQDKPRLALSGTAALSGLRVVERLGASETAKLLSWERLGVTLNRLEPLAGQVDLAAIELKAPSVSISRDAAGLLNLQRVAQGWAGAPASPAAPAAAARPSPPWKVSVARLDIEGGTVHWADAAVKPAADLALESLRVNAQALTWPVQAPVPFELSAQLGQTPLTIKGTATDAEAKAQLAVGEVALSTFASYTADVLTTELDGRLATDVQLEWRAAKADQPMGLKVDASRIELNDARLGPSRQPQASVRLLKVQDVRVDLAASKVEVGTVVINRPQVRAQRDKNGRWMAERWVKASAPGAAPSSKAADTSPWQVTLADVQIDAGAVAYEDLAMSRPVRLDLSQIKLRVKDLQPLARSQPDMPVSLQLRMAGGRGNRADPGRLLVDGTLRLPDAGTREADSLRTRLKVQAERLPVHALEPYFGDRLNLDLLRADTSYRGTVDAAMPPAGLRLAVAGNVSLDDFAANTLTPAEDLLAWKSLQVRGLQLAMAPGQVTRVSVEETVLSDYFARLIIDETGRINLQGLVKHEEQVAAGSAAPAPAPAPAAAPPATTADTVPDPDIRFGPISLVNGRVLFSDRFIKPNYSANLSELTGSLSAFASVPPGGASQMADLTLRGRAEGTAALEIDGKLNPLAQPLALDIRGRVRHLELPPLSPYTVKYAGYGIERGKLSMDVTYKIEPNGQLTASNQVILNQLSFGERVAGSEAPNLPVKLAVALLADRNGVIDIDLPVSGSLNDPQFKLAPLIFRLIFNLIGKAITSPFALIAGAFGGGGEEMNQVGFAAGSKALDAEARQRLDAVAKALADRPALQLTVVGHGDLEAERSGYQRARLDERVLAEKRRLLAREGAAISDNLSVSAAEYPALLKEVYRRADMPKPRNLVGLAKDIPQAEMEALLLASIPVSADAIRDLAVARGVVVKDYLATRQLAEDRMFLGAPQMGSQGEKWRPQAELRLAPR